LTTMPFFLWPQQGALKGPGRYLFPILMNHTTREVVEIWDHVSSAIQQELLQKKGIHITGLGTFGVLRQELLVGKNEHLPVDKPVFQLSQNVGKIDCLDYVRQSIADFMPVVPLEYSKLALHMENMQEVVKNCIKLTLLCLSRCISKGLNIDFSFRNMGVLSIRGKKVKMRFYEKFAFSVDATGNLEEVVTNVSCTLLT
ncbi:CCD81 protein, partial [Nothoprocta ornata]|nr:CCD81 protein [Nothoprocta pentlandii]NWY06558.1 CCD81 protein [Nothoprocta ornata]